MSKTAVILAGGVGTRLRPYTTVLPKPLMPIGEYPIMEVIIRQLAATGFNRIILAVNHQAEIIKSFFGNGEKWNVAIEYSSEDQPLGTMGPLKPLEQGLPDSFLVLNGDILTDLNFRTFFESHSPDNTQFSIASYKRTVHSEFGILEVDKSSTLVGFKEKPRNHYLVSMGVYVVSKSALGFIQPDTLFGFDDLMYALLAAGETIKSFNHEGLWLDIGRPDDYMEAIDIFEKRKTQLLPKRLRLAS